MSDTLAQLPFEYLVDATAALPCAGPASQPEFVDISILFLGRFRIRFDAVRHGDVEETWRWSAGSVQRLGSGRSLAVTHHRPAADR